RSLVIATFYVLKAWLLCGCFMLLTTVAQGMDNPSTGAKADDASSWPQGVKRAKHAYLVGDLKSAEDELQGLLRGDLSETEQIATFSNIALIQAARGERIAAEGTL